MPLRKTTPKVCRLLPSLLLALLLFPCTPVTAEQMPACISQGWPHEGSDLKADPKIRFGTLENGLRYLIRPNQEPRNRVALYLNMQAGSLAEQEAERGLAHYLEHMLFNGSTHYPPGTLIKYFQSMGMDFGADSNAHTAYDETVYKLVLPAADEKTLTEGLRVLADFARGALLPEAEVERERGVILAEKRSRNTAESRAHEARMAFDFAGTLVAERFPIGTERTLKAADAKALRTFYDAWYRPDNLILVMVGDLNVEQAERLARQQFAGLAKAAESKTQCPNYGTPEAPKTQRPRVLQLTEKELGHTEITLATVRPEKPGPDSFLRESEQMKEYLAFILLNNRLRQLEREKGSPLSTPWAYSGFFIPEFRYTVLSARSEAAQWEKALALLTGALEQALADGFTEAELVRGKKELLSELEREAQTASARDSRELAMEYVRVLNAGEVIMSPEEQQKVFAPVVSGTTLAEVNSALRRLWPEATSPARALSVVGDALAETSKADAEKRVAEVYAGALAKNEKPWQEQARVAFPYLPVASEAVAPEQESVDADTAVHTLVFPGNVTAHLKKTDFKPNQVLLSAQFGLGRQDEPWPGAAVLAQGLVRDSGTGTMSAEQLREALAGANVGLEFGTNAESFSFDGEALSAELETLLQLLQARLLDPGFRPEAFTQARERLKQGYAQMAASVEGVAALEGERFLADGSPYYTMPSWQELEALKLEQLAEWLKPVFQTAPLELNLVGDFDMERAKTLLSRYFGGEKRTALTVPAPAKRQFPAGKTLTLTAPEAADKALLEIAWQTDDFWDIQRSRTLNLLASVLDDRLRLKIREELGAAYSPQVASQPSRIDPGFGLMMGQVVVEPKKAEALAQVARDVAAGLAKEGITVEEFRRAQEPTLTAIRDQLRQNEYWLRMVMNLSSRHPEQLEWPKTILKDFTAIGPEALSRLAKEYLAPEKAATLLVLPKK